MNIAYIAFEESSRINPLDLVNCAVLFNKISIVLFGRMAQLTDILTYSNWYTLDKDHQTYFAKKNCYDRNYC